MRLWQSLNACLGLGSEALEAVDRLYVAAGKLLCMRN